jgi:hypothetical protein
MPELAISAEKVGFLIEKMREFDVKEEVSDPDSGSMTSRRRCPIRTPAPTAPTTI